MFHDKFEVFDDFLANPEKFKQSAFDAGFGSWRPNKGEVGSSIYDGMCFWGDHGVALKALIKRLNKGIVPNSMFFRITNENTEKAYTHSDREMGNYTAIVYLSHHDENESGTGFYKHRETGYIRMPSFADLRTKPEFFEKLKTQMVDGGEQDWEQINFVPGKYNRCVVFDAPRFHARHPRHGFGTDEQTGRCVWVCHFDIYGEE